MTFKDCKAYGLLSKKAKYTIRDAKNAQTDSLFKPYKGKTLSLNEARFLCRCSAIEHDAEFSKSLKPDLLNGMI